MSSQQFNPSITQKFAHLPQEVQELIARNAPNTISVQAKGNKKGTRYKCYNSNGKCIGIIKGKPNSKYWETDVGQYDKHHSQKIDPLDIAKGISITAIKSFF